MEIAINNRVSQSVPHLHVLIVPRRKKTASAAASGPAANTPRAKPKPSATALRDAMEGSAGARSRVGDQAFRCPLRSPC
jgi:diadenosine tetraphosphate (Ap4A) HIT family hydrolase